MFRYFPDDLVVRAPAGLHYPAGNLFADLPYSNINEFGLVDQRKFNFNRSQLQKARPPYIFLHLNLYFTSFDITKGVCPKILKQAL